MGALTASAIAVAAVLLVVAISAIGTYREERDDRIDERNRLNGLLEGARADAIMYARTSERLAAVLELAHGHIARMTTDGKVPTAVTAGRLALQQIEALRGNGSAGYYGKRDVAEPPNGAAPWMPRAAADPALVAKWKLVSDAIATRSGTDHRMGRHLRSVADDLLSAGLDHDEVAKRILAGDTADV